jgi:hypothetical protein
MNADVDEVFYDALDFVPSLKIEGEEPLEREVLPYFKDPK